MNPSPLFALKQAPFLRLILPLISGIIFQHFTHFPSLIAWTVLFVASTILASHKLLPIHLQFRSQWLLGIAIHLLIAAAAMLFTFYKNIQHHPQWIGKVFPPTTSTFPPAQKTPATTDTAIIATLSTPLSEKPKSWKAQATVQSLVVQDSVIPAEGTILLYFQKDSSRPQLQYGNQILFTQPLQPIRNTGNPGAFDYKKYCELQGLYHQVYLQHHQFSLLPAGQPPFFSLTSFQQFLFQTREKILSILRTHIKGKKEAGLAEALLIGYKDDLDKDLIQSYAVTGVVHVIAISGLHLGIIYLLLGLLCKPLGKRKHVQWLQPVLIIAGLWLFALLAGASPSVIRSAVMFSCIVIGNSFSKQSSIYNSLAASAFLLLCYNPFWLWDSGFQLSYMAVLSLAIFLKPIYHRLSIRNPLLDMFWKLNATTIAAQVLTIPVCLYYFHQFPVLFLLTNLVAVPLSSIILIGEILLCSLSFIPFVAKAIGSLLYYLIWYMNQFIEQVHQLSFAAIENIPFNLLQLFLLYGCIAAIALWLLHKNRKAFITGIALAGGVMAIHSWNAWQALQQQQMIVYQVPENSAMDFIHGRQYAFKGDPIFLHNELLAGFHLQPARTLRMVSPTDSLKNLYCSNHFYFFGNIAVLRICPDFPDKYPQATVPTHFNDAPVPIDLLIISGNPSLRFHQLISRFTPRQVVIDGSNSSGKAMRWYQDCQRAGIPCYVTAWQGAFVLNGY